jgi:adenylate cyclase class 2
VADVTREVEIKLRLETAAAGVERLAAAGFQAVQGRAFESNEVYDTADLRLRAARALLRLRESAGETILTYKGPPEAGPHKSREEIETRVEKADALRAVLARLGYEPVFRYEKYRTTFGRAGEAGHVVLDETPIGVFLELEGEPGWIDRTAAELGSAPQQYITESYGTLYRLECERRGVVPSHMVFGPPQP